MIRDSLRVKLALANPPFEGSPFGEELFPQRGGLYAVVVNLCESACHDRSVHRLSVNTSKTIACVYV